jgi:chorismate synthase
MIRYYTAGESHGKCGTVILEGIPAGLKINQDYINNELARRQEGYGRGKRMEIEKDKVNITSGIRWGETLGSPICMMIKNRDWKNWETTMSVDEKDRDESVYITRSRPGHADLPGVLKYERHDVRDILERASARETAARVAAGAIAKRLLEEFGIQIASFTSQIGKVKAEDTEASIDDIARITSDSPLKCLDKEAEEAMMEEIKSADEAGDTIGGVFTVVVDGLPFGLGTHTQWDIKLDARLARAVMSIQAIKGVEIGKAFEMITKRGSKVHDEIRYDSDQKKFYHVSNNAGGIEGGMTNGERLVVRAAMKPISSLKQPLSSVDIKTKENITAEIVRSDVCAVPAAGVVGEAAVALELAAALLEKTGGDSMMEAKRNYENYLRQVKGF